MTSKQLYYSALCVAGFCIPTGVGFVPWVRGHGLNPLLFFRDLFANQVSTFFALDLILSAVVVISFAYAERGETNRRLWWLPAAAVLVGGVSFGLPLLLYMREAHREKSFAEKAG